MKLEIGGGRSRNGWSDINLGNFDLRNMQMLRFNDNSVDKVFSSHCIEHIEDKHFVYLLSELNRIMKPGAIMRLSCPDADMLYEAYGRAEESKFRWVYGKSLEERFVNCFVSYESGSGVPNVYPEKVKRLYKELSKEDFLNWTLCHVDEKRPYIAHRNWFNYEKLERVLNEADFVNIKKSEYGGSKDDEFKNGFDLHKDISIYIECHKSEIE